MILVLRGYSFNYSHRNNIHSTCTPLLSPIPSLACCKLLQDTIKRYIAFISNDAYNSLTGFQHLLRQMILTHEKNYSYCAVFTTVVMESWDACMKICINLLMDITSQPVSLSLLAMLFLLPIIPSRISHNFYPLFLLLFLLFFKLLLCQWQQGPHAVYLVADKRVYLVWLRLILPEMLPIPFWEAILLLSYSPSINVWQYFNTFHYIQLF